MFRKFFLESNKEKEKLIKKLSSKRGEVRDFKYVPSIDAIEVKVKNPIKNLGFLFDYIEADELDKKYQKYDRYMED